MKSAKTTQKRRRPARPPAVIAPSAGVQFLAEPDSLVRRLAYHMVRDLLALAARESGLAKLHRGLTELAERLVQSQDAKDVRAGTRLIGNLLRHESTVRQQAIDYAAAGLEAHAVEIMESREESGPTPESLSAILDQQTPPRTGDEHARGTARTN